MEQERILRAVELAAYSALALAALRHWHRQRSAPAGYAAGTFGVLAGVVIAARFLPDDGMGGLWLRKALVAVLLLFPLLLFRFAGTFGRFSAWVERAAAGGTAVLIVWTVALPSIPQSGAPRPSWYAAFVFGVLAQWTLLFGAVAVRLLRAARGQAAPARRRMRFLALGAIGMNAAVIISGASPSAPGSALAIAVKITGLGAALLFLLGVAPPRLMRLAWRQPAEAALRRATRLLLAAGRKEEVARRLLPHAAAIVGASGAALYDAAGEPLGAHRLSPAEVEALRSDRSPGVVRVELERATLVVVTGPYAPFFGREETELLSSLGVMVDLALERCDTAERERAFVSNAAHELRTPLTTLLGASAMLAQHGGALAQEQLDELVAAMNRQGERATRMIDDLLDLAELDRGRSLALEPIPLANLITRVLEMAPPPEGTAVDVPDVNGMRVLGNRSAMERVLVNLLHNSYRHGGPNVRVEVAQEDGRAVISVADDGPGVAGELITGMWEPFRRSPWAGGRGSGLGLTICRGLVEAMGGDIAYAANSPTGARFTVRLRGAA